MRVEELRIGNLLDRTDYICKVIKIAKEGVILEPLNYTNELFVKQDIKPIPLTEEWLLKFGFFKDEYKKWNGNGYDYQPKDVYTEEQYYTLDYFDDKNIQYKFSKWHCKEYEPEIQDAFIFYGYCLIKCDYVHQLQNLYFALTNEELKIKE